MKLYTCEDGKSLSINHSASFGAWSEKEADDFMKENKEYYQFNVDDDNLYSDTQCEYPYYVNGCASLIFESVKWVVLIEWKGEIKLKTNVENGVPAMFMGIGGLVEESGFKGLYWFNTPIRIRDKKEDVLLFKDDVILFEV